VPYDYVMVAPPPIDRILCPHCNEPVKMPARLEQGEHAVVCRRCQSLVVVRVGEEFRIAHRGKAPPPGDQLRVVGSPVWRELDGPDEPEDD